VGSWLERFVQSECLFTDNAALVCSSREDAVFAAEVFNEVIIECGLTLSIAKTKLLVAGIGLSEDDLAPLVLSEGVVGQF